MTMTLMSTLILMAMTPTTHRGWQATTTTGDNTGTDTNNTQGMAPTTGDKNDTDAKHKG